MLGDGRDEVAGLKDLEIAPDLGIEARAVQDGDFLVFGRETKGLPASLLAAYPESAVTIPMIRGTRSLNLATSAGIVLYEAIRQIALAEGKTF